MASLLLLIGASSYTFVSPPSSLLLSSSPSSSLSPSRCSFPSPAPSRSLLNPPARRPSSSAIPLLATVDPAPRFLPGDLEIDWKRSGGGGGFGEVFFGRLREGEERREELRVVAKVPYLEGDGRKAWNLERYINVKLMARAGAWRDRFMPRYLGCSGQREGEGATKKFVMVWEREDGKTLQDHLMKPGGLSAALGVKDQTKTIRPIFCEKVVGELLLAVEFLHRNGVVHRDIKPSNILMLKGRSSSLQPEALLKLIDFGSACDVKGLLRPGSRFRSLDPLYSPPEVEMDQWYPEEYDSYLVGMTGLMVLFPSLALNFPDNLRAFKRDSLPEAGHDLCVLCAISQSRFDQLSLEARALGNGQHDKLLEVLRGLLERKPHRRLSAASALVLLGEPWKERLKSLPSRPSWRNSLRRAMKPLVCQLRQSLARE